MYARCSVSDLTDAHRFLKEQFPSTPIMYRPPTYLADIRLPHDNYWLVGVTKENLFALNEGIYHMSQGAEFVADRLGLQVFRCKLRDTDR